MAPAVSTTNSVFVAVFLSTLVSLWPASALKPLKSVKPQDDGKPAAVMLRARVSELTFLCQAVGINLDDSKIPTVVTRVRPATPAAQAGMIEGDRITRARAAGNILTLDFERKGVRYTVNLEFRMKAVRERMAEQERLFDPPEKPQTLREAVSPPRKIESAPLPEYLLKAQTPDTAKFFKNLAPYKVVLLIDHSGSMNGGLGIGPYDISRWGWCRNQISDFSEFCQGKLKGGITIIPFNDIYTVKENATHAQVEDVFNSIAPGGETNIYAPLSYAISSHLSRPDHSSHPVLIVVLTDGVPNRGGSLDRLISEASQVLHKNEEMIITFLTIGQAPDGDELIERLDRHLEKGSASHDIVSSMRFSELLQIGLKNALLDTVLRANQGRARVINPPE